MTLPDKKPYSKIGAISTIDALSATLGIPAEELVSVGANVPKFWRPGKVLRKKDGKLRPTSDAKPKLKQIHGRILGCILKRTHYPDYILGGIKDEMTPRDHARHAALHTGKCILISEDVKDFFPSATADVIFSIWRHVFRFSPTVSTLLTALTTHNGSLPQGWKTSGYLANLVFWEREPCLVDELRRQGFAYSRFMDDISVSSPRKMVEREKRRVIARIYGMLFSKGFKPKRNKHRIDGTYKRMEVTGLTVNGDAPTLPETERKKIRAAVHRCELASNKASEGYRKLWHSTSGKVSKLTRFHKMEAKDLRGRLRAVKPPEGEIPTTERQKIEAAVRVCESAKDRKSARYSRLWHAASAQVGKLAKQHKTEGVALRLRLTLIEPLREVSKG